MKSIFYTIIMLAVFLFNGCTAQNTPPHSTVAPTATVSNFKKILGWVSLKNPKSSVHMRAGPSLSDEIIQTLPHGVQVEVLIQGAWDKVLYQGKTGYIQADFITANREMGVAGNVLQGISLTTGNACIGDYRPVAVMVENTRAARPQNGVASADVVYEMEVEGGITRLLCIFQDKVPGKVGPVRSARDPFAKIAKEWDGLFVHYGGASCQNACDIETVFKHVSLSRHVDGITQEANFWRTNHRKSPHNVYCDATKLQRAYDYNAHLRGLKFSDKAIQDGTTAYTVRLSYPVQNHILYVYDVAKRAYKHYIEEANGRVAFADAVAKNQPITVCNIVIQYAKHHVQPCKHVLIDLVGEGKATYFVQGKKVTGTWSKTSLLAPTIFKDAKGQEMTFQKGNTWIQVVKPNAEVYAK